MIECKNVKNMGGMFEKCKKFNQPLNNWIVSNVEICFMFSKCKMFNQPLNKWDVSNVENMSSMFSNCDKFNQPLNDWNLINLKYMEDIFYYCNISKEYIPFILKNIKDN